MHDSLELKKERESVARFNRDNERTTFIVECFEEFYREVLKYKQLVYSRAWEKASEDSSSSPEAIAEYIISNLQNYLEQQAKTVSYGGDSFAENYYDEAQFIMVALADEVFLSIDWPGRKYWETNLLEQRLYNSHSAGQTFFDALDELLEAQNPIRIDIASLYLSALGLDFQGKYRHFSDEGALESYRKRLFSFINRREPYLFKVKTTLFPEAYSHTLEGSGTKELPNLRNWYYVFAGLALTYLLISYIIWYSATWDISRILNRIISYNTGGI